MENYYLAPFDHRILEVYTTQVERLIKNAKNNNNNNNSNTLVKSIIHASIDGFIHCYDFGQNQNEN